MKNKMMVLHNEAYKLYNIGCVEYQKLSPPDRKVFEGSIKNDTSFLPDVFKEYDEIVTCENFNNTPENYSSDVSIFKIENSNPNRLNDILYVIKNGEAHIPVVGVMSRGGEIDSTYVKWGYSSTYNEITMAVKLADLDSRVTGDIVLATNTPGGAVDGVDMAAQAVYNAKKRVRADIYYWNMSGGVWITSQADEIRAMSETVYMGSLGVAYEYYDWTKYLEEIGIVEHTITSQNAPYKRPDGDELDSLLQKDADELEAVFLKRVSDGRTKASGKAQTVEYVAEKYGQGWDVIAEEALSRGMIDSIVDYKSNNDDSINVETLEDDSMDMDVGKLREKYPELCQTLTDEATASGVEAERNRVSSHLKWLDKADSKSVLKNIEEGVECSNEVVLEYSDQREQSILQQQRINDDDGHEEHSGEEPSAQGAQNAGLNSGDSARVNDDKLRQCENTVTVIKS